MAYGKVENPNFSGVVGFWKPEKGETIEGVALKLFKSGKKGADGNPMTPFYVIELLSSGKGTTVKEGSGKNVKSITVKKGDLIGINRSSQLEVLDSYPGCPFKLTFKDRIPLDGGKSVKDFEILVDQETKVKDIKAIPVAGKGSNPGEPGGDEDETETPA